MIPCRERDFFRCVSDKIPQRERDFFVTSPTRHLGVIAKIAYLRRCFYSCLLALPSHIIFPVSLFFKFTLFIGTSDVTSFSLTPFLFYFPAAPFTALKLLPRLVF